MSGINSTNNYIVRIYPNPCEDMLRSTGLSSKKVDWANNINDKALSG